MKILITGSAGFLGGHLTRELEAYGYTVVGVDRAHGGPDLRSSECVEAVFDQHSDADVCVHLAAKVGRLFGEDNPIETVIDNVGMTALVARACGEHGIRLCYASTSEVYGDNGETACDEDAGPFSLPHNLYGISKFHGEDVCRHYAPEGLTIFRFSMPYGPGLPAGRGRAAIVNMLHQALRREPIPVHVGAERSWCWVGDTVRAVRAVIEETPGGVFNVGRDDNPVSMEYVAQVACELTGASEGLIRLVDAPMNQTVVKRLSTDRIRALGWSPQVDLIEGMGYTLEWVRTLAEDGSVKQEVTVEAKEK
jgi:nucleoside-diphosphate-sugar epimerase